MRSERWLGRTEFRPTDYMRAFVIDDEFLALNCFTLLWQDAFVRPAEGRQFSSPRMISIRPAVPAVKGLRARYDERAEERAPLTAAASGQIMQLSGAKKTKKIYSGQKQPGTGVYAKFFTLPLQPKRCRGNSSNGVDPLAKTNE